ncbi:MAG: carbohydrate kinase [Clostridiales bacterium]|nr:carbohydrate kinase [Clostridiales bacterium]
MSKGTLVAIGEALIDFIPSRKGCDFDDVESFFPAVGGAPANVCAAFSRLGGKSAFLTQLGDDPFGHKIIRELNRTGIDTSYIALTDEANTALAFVSLAADGDRTFSFYRKPSADMLFSPSQVDERAFDDIFALHFCSVSLGDFPMKSAHSRAIGIAQEKGALISFDPNLRFMLWNSEEALKNAVLEFIPKADVLKISDDELEFITGFTDIEEALPRLFGEGVKLVLFTCGKDGMFAFTKNASAHKISPAVNVVDTTGAGDASIGSFLWKLNASGITKSNIETVTSEVLDEALDFATKFCALSIQQKGAIPSYPTLEQVMTMGQS